MAKLFVIVYRDSIGQVWWLNMLDYPSRLHSVIWEQIVACLEWLANYHATFLEERPRSPRPQQRRYQSSER